MYKRCAQCARLIPLSGFFKNAMNNSGYNKTCIVCGEHQREYYIANKEKLNKYRRQYRIDNKEKINKRKREKKKANKEKIVEAVNKAKKKKISEQWRNYYKANKEDVKERQRTRRLQNINVYREKEMAQAGRMKEKLIQQGRQETLSIIIDAFKDTLPPEALDKLKSLNEVT